MTIEEIKKELLYCNYLVNKNIDINKISSGKKYSFVCDKGHVFKALPCNTFRTGKFSCPYCSGKKVLKGFNDLWTTHPEYAILLKSKEDGYRYSFGSNKKIWWVCPDCYNERFLSPNKMINNKNICNICKSDISYPEKFIANLLSQFFIHYEKEKKFEWSNNKRYDFYIPKYNCIIETHGKQHYSNSDFSYKGGKTYIEEQSNDCYKKYQAQTYGGIKNYIVIDCRKSELKWIKHSVMESGLLEILYIIPETIDWYECHEFALENTNKIICEEYTKIPNIKYLCQMFDLSYNSIKNKLKQGAEIGWCDYNPQEARNKAYKENGKMIIERMSKPVIQMDNDYNIIQEFPSLQEAQRQLKISHIWDCVVGKRKTAGGFKWKYKEFG